MEPMRTTPTTAFLRAGLMAALLAALCTPAMAGSLRDRLLQRAQSDMLAGDTAPATIPPGVRVLRDVPYGDDPAQRMDVYLPVQGAAHAPVIFMVHGGAWAYGDKAMRSVVQNKVARWVPRGFVLVSTNYRMLPGTRPIEQARDVARALAAAQGLAAGWGADRDRFILMGHSAGAHLVGLISAEPVLAFDQGALPWLGTVALDSAALNVVAIMQGPHLPLYDAAFGDDPAYWRAASPLQQLATRGAPFLAVCSTRRRESCPQARNFVAEAEGLHMRAQVLGEDLSHRQINEELGTPGDYTTQVEAFMASLDPQVARRLGDR
ncbi:alpha/beta hydrolase [Fulvimonas yonginensis]|uniref:Alpha/beta hydrolase n=1 Tax=Fulvimonas yonginensis TaxID=1495200 RepID=A0ABU8JCC6_9GAMM